MKRKELINAIIKKYESLQEISTDIPGGKRSNVSRGTKHVISSYLEDILGVFISDLLPRRKYEVIVDQTFYFGTSRSQFRPDICIIKKEEGLREIVGFVEVKDSPNPFRWNSEKFQNRGVDYINQRCERLEEFHGNYLRYKEINSDKIIEILVDVEAKIDLVLISNQLFSKRKFEELSIACKESEFINLHIFLYGYHPNLKGNRRGLKPDELIEVIEEDTEMLLYNEEAFRNRIKEIEII